MKPIGLYSKPLGITDVKKKDFLQLCDVNVILLLTFL